MSYVVLPDPDPGRCQNTRWDQRTMRSYRCTQYEGSEHTCRFDIPQRVAPPNWSARSQVIATTATPKPWVRPEDRR